MYILNKFSSRKYLNLLSTCSRILKKGSWFPYCRWYFAMLSISGIFAVTFSVVFAYVADITTDEDRGQAYGLVRN